MLNKIRNIIINLLLAILAGSLLLMLVFLIPTDAIDKHIKESAYTLSLEGAYPTIFESSLSNLDNFTDSLMLLEAANKNDEDVVNRAMSVYRIDYKDETIGPYNTLIKHYVNNEDYEILTSYERYWHGYLVTLKPLLFIFNYSQIRVLNLIIESLLTILVLASMYKRKLNEYIIPYAISYLLLNPYVISLSLQYSTIFYIFTISTLLILLVDKDKLVKYSYLLFLNIGIFTAYFDYLTYPIVSFGMPLLVYLGRTKEFNIKSTFSLMVYWAIGYFVMWGSKWILGDIFTNETVIKDAIDSVINRTSSVANGQKYSILDCIYSNYAKFIATPIKYIFILYVVICIAIIVKNKKKIDIHVLTIYIYVALLPILWYSFTINHSMLHDYLFTNKTALLSFGATMFYLGNTAKSA